MQFILPTLGGENNEDNSVTKVSNFYKISIIRDAPRISCRNSSDFSWCFFIVYIEFFGIKDGI